MAEQRTLNPFVGGSNPPALTKTAGRGGEMADALSSGGSFRKELRVQVPLPAPRLLYGCLVESCVFAYLRKI